MRLDLVPLTRAQANAVVERLIAEVARLATDGTPNACSVLYAACARAARAMGYELAITYTLLSEPGTSLRAAGWERDGVVRRDGKGWSSRDNRAETGDEEEPRVRWSKRLRADRGIPAELLPSEKALRLRAKGAAQAAQQELFGGAS